MKATGIIALAFLILSSSVSFAVDCSNATESKVKRQTFLNEKFSIDKDGMVRVAFFDADSTLRISKSGSVSANKVDDVVILPKVAPKIAELVKAGYLIAVVSNQGGIAANQVCYQTSEGALATTLRLIKKYDRGARIHYFDFAEKKDEFRKPGTGMANRLLENLTDRFADVKGINWDSSFMVGDSAYKKGEDIKPDGSPGTHFSNADRLFAENLMQERSKDFKFHLPNAYFDWQGIDVFHQVWAVQKYCKDFEADAACEAALNLTN